MSDVKLGHTEEEVVRYLACPAALMSGSYDTCNGSKCMAWRWIMQNTSMQGAVPHWERSDRGYCGLAGKP